VKRLTIATTNAGKVIEIGSGLEGLTDWLLESLPPDTPPIEETGTTFTENAVQKALHFSRTVEGPTLGDDSGLCVAALGGRPGLHSARYAETVTARMEKLLGELKDVPEKERQAHFVCALAIAEQGKVIWTVEREVHSPWPHCLCTRGK
jgi:XTP/dITP diphosphohydrolase